MGLFMVGIGCWLSVLTVHSRKELDLQGCVNSQDVWQMCKRCWLMWSAARWAAAWLGAVWTTARSTEHVLSNTQSQCTLTQKMCFCNLYEYYVIIKISNKYASLTSVLRKPVLSKESKTTKNIYCVPVVRQLHLILGFLALEVWAGFIKELVFVEFFWEKLENLSV